LQIKNIYDIKVKFSLIEKTSNIRILVNNRYKPIISMYKGLKVTNKPVAGAKTAIYLHAKCKEEDPWLK